MRGAAADCSLRRPAWVTWLFTMLAASLLAACTGKDVYANLQESEANDMVAVLMNAGIAADKEAGEKENWSVSVASGDFARAVDVLRANGLPREKFDTLGTVFKKEGFTSSPLAEHARLIYGLSQELSNTISQIDGVVQARVHLTMPEPDPLSRAVLPSSASVFVKYREGFNLRSQTAALKTLVTNSVEGLSYDRVSVVMVQAEPRAVGRPAGMSGSMLTYAAWLAGAIGVAALIAGVLSWWRQRKPGALRLPSLLRK